jgi:hypothetical protein
MHLPFRVGFSPGISFRFCRGIQDVLKMLLTKPSLHWRSIEKPDALEVAATRIAADSPAHSQLQRLVSHIKSTIRPNAIYKLLDDFSGAAWIRLELG